MIKYIGGLLLSSLIFAGVYYGVLRFKANYLEDGAYFSANTVTLKSDRVSRLESQGFDARVYEFTPQTKKTYTCIVYKATNAAAMVCLPKV